MRNHIRSVHSGRQVPSPEQRACGQTAAHVVGRGAHASGEQGLGWDERVATSGCVHCNTCTHARARTLERLEPRPTIRAALDEVVFDVVDCGFD